MALDIRMYLRDEIGDLHELLAALQKVIVDLADRHRDVVLPGYTHLQRAQPVLFGHHLLAYYEMFSRDRGRLQDCFRRVNVMPLGAGALAGTVLPIDRKSVAKELGFSGVCENSMDAVSDRDFAIEFAAACAQIMMHLSRLSEELVIWSTAEFGFITISDAFTTGSSIMPQKKNPDVAELTRGKTGRVYGSLIALLTLMKGLPLAYNRDMQEDKEPLFDAADTRHAALAVFTEMLKSMTVHAAGNAPGGRGRVYYRHRPCRLSGQERHALPRCSRGGGQGRASRAGAGLRAHAHAARGISETVAADPEGRVRGLSVEASVGRRSSYGGTAPTNLEKRLQVLKKKR